MSLVLSLGSPRHDTWPHLIRADASTRGGGGIGRIVDPYLTHW